ncbi:MAG: AMP-binding protein [Clostridia bacterium]|nr:AMP-binding protein [Clostridia bacterium]
MLKEMRKMRFTDLKDMLDKTEEMYKDRPAYKLKTQEGKYKVITHKEFRQQIKELGTGLIDLGLKDERIAVISENRYEWSLAYLAIATGTGIVVPLDKSLPANEIESLMIRSEVKGIFYSKKYDEIMQNIREKGTTQVKYFISMDEEKHTETVYSQKAILEKGKELILNGDTRFLDAKIVPEEMGIMLFTSGTTSISKAVMLSHKNIINNVMDIRSTFELDETDRMLSFLPLHHVFECTVGFLYPISIGCMIAYCDGVKHMADNLKEYQITAIISVPAVFDIMYRKLLQGIAKKGKTETVKKGIKITQLLLKLGIDTRKKIFAEIHENLGGKIRLMVAGGAALDPATEKGFNELGFNIVQGYGLTETSPVIAAELTKQRRLGSIGKKFPSVEVKIGEPNEEGIGELLAKGPTVMLGYYNNEEATKEAIEEDGWFHTGDLARIDKDGYIFISGRKKNVIVLQNGKNIYPEEIEILINKIEGIKESIVYGKPDNGDLSIATKVVYDKEQMKELYNIEQEDKIKEFIWEEIKKINKTMPAYKYIRDLLVTEEELIKTTTLKVKRHEEIKRILNGEGK